MKKFSLLVLALSALLAHPLKATPTLTAPEKVEQMNQFAKEIVPLEKTISAIRLSIVEDKHLTSHEIKYHQKQIRKILVTTQLLREKASTEVAQYEDMLDELPPEEYEPQDTQSKAYKQHLEQALDTYKTILNRADSVIKRGQKLLGILSQKEIQLKGYELLSVRHPLSSAGAYTNLTQETQEMGSQVEFHSRSIFSNLLSSISQTAFIVQFIGFVLAVLVILVPIRSLTRYLDKRFLEPDDSAETKTASFMTKTLYFGVYPCIVFFLVPTFLKASGITSPIQTDFFYITSTVLSGVWLLSTIANITLLKKGHTRLIPAWIAPFSKELASKLLPFILITGLNVYLNMLNNAYDLPSTLTQVTRLGLRVAFGINLLFLLKEKFWATHRENLRVLFNIWRFFSLLIAISNPFLVFFGYTYLADYCFNGYIYSAALLGGMLIVYCIIRHWIQDFFVNSERAIEFFNIKPRMAGLIGYWSNFTVLFLLWIIAIFALLFIWEVGHSIVLTWLSKFMFGIDIAGHHFSFMSILVAIATFIGVFAFTRYFQYLLDKKVFPYTNLDVGLTHAIKTAVGYLGFAFSVLIAIHLLGFNLVNLMYVFGGLSVGVGLGLQPIVINFISGLMMLIERPIKIGDYIQVDGESGVVSSIRVRATEIQTWEHGCVLIPNSRMITNSIKNLTHEDRIVSIEIPVIIKYGQNIEKVRSILLECAKNHEMVYNDPAPQVVLKSFTESTIEIDLRCYLKDISQRLKVSSDLRFEIEEALKKAHIAPYP